MGKIFLPKVIEFLSVSLEMSIEGTGSLLGRVLLWISVARRVSGEGRLNGREGGNQLIRGRHARGQRGSCCMDGLCLRAPFRLELLRQFVELPFDQPRKSRLEVADLPFEAAHSPVEAVHSPFEHLFEAHEFLIHRSVASVHFPPHIRDSAVKQTD
jgi:hypothetical protein